MVQRTLMLACVVASVAAVDVLPAQLLEERDSVPSFDQLAREVLVVRLQAEAMRGSLAGATIGSGPWKDSIRAAELNVEQLTRGIHRLEVAFRDARHRRGMKLSAELASPLVKIGRALRALSTADDARIARAELTHLVAGLEALLQTIDQGKMCCQMKGRD
jgi:hypothetical protein